MIARYGLTMATSGFQRPHVHACMNKQNAQRPCECVLRHSSESWMGFEGAYHDLPITSVSVKPSFSQKTCTKEAVLLRIEAAEVANKV